MADGGTLFLDEIGEMPAALQTKLLRTLQERTILPVGAEEEIPIDVRVVAATNMDIQQQVAVGKFRQDLFYRLVAFPIVIPALRERPSDIPELAYHFLNKHRREADRNDVTRIDDQAMALLLRHPWPGNVRQLENALYHALLTAKVGGSVSVDVLPEDVQDPSSTPLPVPAAPPRLDSAAPESDGSPGKGFHDPETGKLLPLRRIEELAFELALEENDGNTTRAAKALGVARATLYRRLKSKKAG